MQAQVIQDQQVRSQEGAEGALQGVVHPGPGHDFEEVVGVAEADGVAGPDGGVAEGLGQEALAHAGGSHQQHVLVPGQEFQGEGGVEEPTVQGN